MAVGCRLAAVDRGAQMESAHGCRKRSALPCALQWRLLDGSRASLALALLAAVGGPLAELPLMKLGAWHYLTPDYWPLAAWSCGPGTGNEWAGLSAITGPCYFAVTTDAIALGRWFGSEQESVV